MRLIFSFIGTISHRIGKEMFKQCEKVAKSRSWCSRHAGNCYNGAF